MSYQVESLVDNMEKVPIAFCGGCMHAVGAQEIVVSRAPLHRDSLSLWVKVLRIIPEFGILRLTFHRKSASKF